MRIIVDTDILIEILRKNEEVIRQFEKIKDEELYISAITEGEVLIGKECEEEKVLDKVLKLLSIFKKIEISNQIVRKAAELGRKYKAKLIDCIIASTALSINAKIFTRNVKDFQKIGEVELLQFD
jgi:predicted nucleic acid-binding protein